MDFFGLLQELKEMVTIITLANAATGHKDNSIPEDLPSYLQDYSEIPSYRIDSGKKR